MSLLEVLGLLIAATSGVAIPMAVARRAQQRELEQQVQGHAVKLAQLEARSEVVDSLRQDLHDLRNDVKEMTGAVARLEATMANK